MVGSSSPNTIVQHAIIIINKQTKRIVEIAAQLIWRGGCQLKPNRDLRMDTIADDIVLEIASWCPTISLISFLTSHKRLWNLRTRKSKATLRLEHFKRLFDPPPNRPKRIIDAVVEAAKIGDAEII